MLSEKIVRILNEKINDGFVTNIEVMFDDFYEVLECINDGFNIDIDIVLNYNCYPVYYILLSISYNEDVFEDDNRIDIFLNYIENNNNNMITITSIEDIIE